MKLESVATLIMLTIICVGCDKSPRIRNTQEPDDPRRVEAQPFKGQVYRSFDGRDALTLISADELELREGNTILLCKYSKQTEALRVIVTAMGANQVVYFRFIDTGLQDNNGRILLSPQSYAAAMEQARLAREQEENTKREAERRQRQIEAQKRAAAEELHKKTLAMRDEGVMIVRRFFTPGSIIKAYYQANYNGNKLPFKLALTGDLSFEADKNDPYDQYFGVPAHMTWLADSGVFHSFHNSSYGGLDRASDGMLLGKIVVQRDGAKQQIQISVRYCAPDLRQSPNAYSRNEGSYWNGKEFAPTQSGVGAEPQDRYYRE